MVRMPMKRKRSNKTCSDDDVSDLSASDNWFRLSFTSVFLANKTHWELNLQWNVTRDAVSFVPMLSRKYVRVFERVWQ